MVLLMRSRFVTSNTTYLLTSNSYIYVYIYDLNLGNGSNDLHEIQYARGFVTMNPFNY